jgi:hypothetical protein
MTSGRGGPVVPLEQPPALPSTPACMRHHHDQANAQLVRVLLQLVDGLGFVRVSEKAGRRDSIVPPQQPTAFVSDTAGPPVHRRLQHPARRQPISNSPLRADGEDTRLGLAALCGDTRSRYHPWDPMIYHPARIHVLRRQNCG